MRICLPTTDDRGLAARLSPHFGSAPCFTLLDTATGEVEVLGNDHAVHEHGHCNPAQGLEGRGLDAVVCRGLGRRALQRLQASGMHVLVTDAFTVADALAELEAGVFRLMQEEDACAGHGHDHGHEHGHGPDQGLGA